jgi:ABC-type transport system involved in multi-copper enzyme maturation permease subunit
LSSEKIYFLSKPLKRTTFLWAKCLSTLTISLIITLLSCCILFGIAIYEYITWTNNIFDMRRSENPYAIFGSYLSIAIFGSFVATIWKYQSHGGVWIIICFGMVLIYVVMYPMLVNIDKEDFSDNERFWWLMIPILLYLPLSVIFSLIGAKIFMRSEIES